MRCRHCNADWKYDWEYCPECQRNYGGAVYPAKQTSQELADIAALVARIQHAFANVELCEGTTIHEADLEGVYLDDQVRIDARAKDPETSWGEVPDWKMERFHDALCFFDPPGWRFYLPAYLCWTLKNWRTSDSNTVDAVIFYLKPFDDDDRNGILNDEQSTAVFHFLDFFRRYSGDSLADEAIQAYWHRFQEHAP